MNIGEIFIDRFDLLVVLFLFAMFVLGFIQGTIRRVLGLLSMLFSFLFAANLREPLGSFLASNWTQFPPEYSVMVGFGTVFLAATIAFTLIIQGFYHRQALFEKQTIVDELIGGVLGVVQGLFFIGCMIVILDTFFLIPTIPQTNRELIFLRELHGFFNHSGVAALFRGTLVPTFYAIFGLFIPEALKTFYTSPR